MKRGTRVCYADNINITGTLAFCGLRGRVWVRWDYDFPGWANEWELIEASWPQRIGARA